MIELPNEMIYEISKSLVPIEALSLRLACKSLYEKTWLTDINSPPDTYEPFPGIKFSLKELNVLFKKNLYDNHKLVMIINRIKEKTIKKENIIFHIDFIGESNSDNFELIICLEYTKIKNELSEFSFYDDLNRYVNVRNEFNFVLSITESGFALYNADMLSKDLENGNDILFVDPFFNNDFNDLEFC